jgi:Rha family phage regulatory protein
VAELRQLAAPVVNSRDVAEHFGKRHDNVLRDIEALTTASELRASNWFREVVYLDAKGESRASFDLTRQGFTQSTVCSARKTAELRRVGAREALRGARVLFPVGKSSRLDCACNRPDSRTQPQCGNADTDRTSTALQCLYLDARDTTRVSRTRTRLGWLGTEHPAAVARRGFPKTEMPPPRP